MFATRPNQRRFRRPPSGVSLALLAVIWWAVCREVANRAATGLLSSFLAGALVPLLAATFLLFLVILGFLALDMLVRERRTVREVLCLPARQGVAWEWGLGAAVGWGAVVLAILPLALRRGLYLQTWLAPRGLLAFLIAIATIAVMTLTVEAVFRGYGYRRMQASLGPNLAMIILSVLYAVITSIALGNMTALVISFLFGLLLTTAWRRTHGLWLGWGLHFAWNAALGVLFGLPLFGGTDFSNVIQAQARGKTSLTGAGLGPIAAPWTIAVILFAIVIVVWLTRDLAWAYTHPPIIAAGYPMDVAPPPAHAAMEGSAPPPPLVQIAPSTPQAGSRLGPLR